MAPAGVARAIVYTASLSFDSSVHFMTVMAATMSFIGCGESVSVYLGLTRGKSDNRTSWYRDPLFR